MTRFRLLLILCIVGTFALAAAAFRLSSSSQIPLGSVNAATPMLEPRSGHSATLLRSGTVLVVGGSNATGYLDSGEIFTP